MSDTEARREEERLGSVDLFGCLGSFTLLLLAVYAPALSGPFVSDDFAYFVAHPYTGALRVEHWLAIFDPTGPAKFFTGNYAPLHLGFVALERAFFGDAVVPLHVANVVLHAANATAVAAILNRSGVTRSVSLAAALLFALHPANVEAVAWISQSKTLLAFGLAAGAGCLFACRPGWATVLYVAALAAKAQALFLLPTIAAWLACRRADGNGWRWWALWCGLSLAYAVPAWQAHQALGAVEVADSLGERLGGVLEATGRTAWIGASSLGVAAFQEPRPSVAWRLVGAIIALGVTWRCVVTLRAKRLEGVAWLAAIAAFAPVSQWFPFLHPVADRYLYFIVPSVVGALCLACRDAVLPSAARSVAWILVAGLALGFAARSYERAALWTNETRLLVDAARAFPDGSSAHWLAARAAAQRGEPQDALDALEAATRGEHFAFHTVAEDLGLAPLRGMPAFEAHVDALAGRAVARARTRPPRSQPAWWLVARAHAERGEREGERAALEQALALGGPWTRRVRRALEEAQRPDTGEAP
ncbi:MAG: hypothetical protein AAF430_23675 [Myxococcota bacterium]